MDEGAEAHAGGAFREPGLGIVVPSGAGDVKVDAVVVKVTLKRA